MIRPADFGETPLSPSEAAYLTHDYELPTTYSLPIEFCRNNDFNWQARPNLRQLANEQMGKGSAATCGFEGIGTCRAGTQEAGASK